MLIVTFAAGVRDGGAKPARLFARLFQQEPRLVLKMQSGEMPGHGVQSTVDGFSNLAQTHRQR